MAARSRWWWPPRSRPTGTGSAGTASEPAPAAQLRDIGIRDEEYRTIAPDKVWWACAPHRTEVEYVLAWNEFREHGASQV